MNFKETLNPKTPIKEKIRLALQRKRESKQFSHQNFTRIKNETNAGSNFYRKRQVMDLTYNTSLNSNKEASDDSKTRSKTIKIASQV